MDGFGDDIFYIMKSNSTRIAFVTVIFTALTATGEPFEAVNEEIGLKGLPDLYAAFGDYNNDGWVDLYNGGRLWRNDRGTYTFIRGHGLINEPGIWADYDNDGRLDLYKWMSNKLYRNVNGEKFIDVSDKLPPAPMASSKGACWGDFNGDGFVDIYVGGWEEPGYQPDAIYLNAGNGEFRLHWKEAKNHRPARGVTAADIDGDGDLDIYVSNYRLEQNLLWINDGKAMFEEVAFERDAGGIYGDVGACGHTIGSAIGDLDNDGLFDIFIGNFSHPAAYQDRPQFLRNMGPDHGFKFKDMSSTAKLHWQESYASPALGDYDNDGDLDLYMTTVYGGDRGVLYRNDGNWKFTNVTKEMGVDTEISEQAAWADFDNDGDLDLCTNGTMYRNPGFPNHHWLKVRVFGGGTVNRAGIGTSVRIDLPNTILVRQVEGATGGGNQNDLTLHFGLGQHDQDVTLNVYWPDGTKQKVTAVVDQRIDVRYESP